MLMVWKISVYIIQGILLHLSPTVCCGSLAEYQQKSVTGHLNCRGKDTSPLSCLCLIVECSFEVERTVAKKHHKAPKQSGFGEGRELLVLCKWFLQG